MNWIGTKEVGDVSCEGRGGWRAEDYLTQKTVREGENPFYREEAKRFDIDADTEIFFDFAAYLEDNHLPCPDFVCIWLGANDGFSYDAAMMTKTMAQEIQNVGKTYGKTVAVLVFTEYLLPTGAVYSPEVNDPEARREKQFAYYRYQETAFADMEEVYLIADYAVLNGADDRVCNSRGAITDSVHLSVAGYVTAAKIAAATLSDLYSSKETV